MSSSKSFRHGNLLRSDCRSLIFSIRQDWAPRRQNQIPQEVHRVTLRAGLPCLGS